MEDGQGIDIGAGGVHEIPPGHDAWVVGDEPWVTIEWQSGRPLESMLDADGERVVASILFSDIVDSTSTLELLGDACWRDLLLQHSRLMREQLNLYRGREVKTTGDGFLAVFDGATRAVRCGLAVAAAVRELGIAIRVGATVGTDLQPAPGTAFGFRGGRSAILWPRRRHGMSYPRAGSRTSLKLVASAGRRPSRTGSRIPQGADR